MRSFVPDYELKRVQSLDQALDLFAADPSWTPIAGGTDIMVQFEAGHLKAKRLVDLWNVRELQGIAVTTEHVVLGALTTYTQAQKHDVIAREFPSIAAAGAETGGFAIQNRGTIGGNIANASPAADTPPALLTYDAELELQSKAGGKRYVPYDGFHLGYKKTVLAPGELIRAVRLTRPRKPRQHYYRKVGTRKAQAISKVVAAGMAEKEAGRVTKLRFALGSVAPVTIRIKAVEALIENESKITKAVIAEARRELALAIAPIDDIRSNADYRGLVAGNLLQQFLESI